MFRHLCILSDVLSSLPWCFVIYAFFSRCFTISEPMFRHRTCLLSCFDLPYHCQVWCFIIHVLVFHHLIWYFATMLDVSSSFLIFCDTMRCFATFPDVSSSCLMFCHHFWYLLVLSDVSPSYLMFVVLPDVLSSELVAFVFLIKKHKPTRKREPNYGCSDSFHGIRRRRFLRGLIEHNFVNIPFFSPHFLHAFHLHFPFSF